MKTKRKILSLAISALLAVGTTSYAISSYAKDDKDSEDKTTKVEEKKVETPKSDSSKSTESSDSSKSTKSSDSGKSAKSSDSDKRSANDSGDKSHQKVTICHVPPGNPANKHTIHIAFSAWAAHKAHTNTIGPDYADYLGSCNSKATSNIKETLHVISGCTGTTRETLETKAQDYYEPIIVADTSLDDETVATAMSQCLDKGDSDDSGKSHGDSSKSTSGGKGRGYDSVSDSGKHHRIRGCQNKDTQTYADSGKHHGMSDSDKDDNNLNHHKKLKSADSGYDAAHNIKDQIVVSDSSLDDKDVWKEYKTCAADSNNSNKIDSGKTGKKKGDSGHKHYIVKSCGDAQDQKLRDAITTYKAKTSTKDIVLTASAYNDVTVKAAVDACVSAGAKDTTTDSFSSNIAIHGVTINDATITNAVVSGDVITGGTITAGTSPTATVVGGIISGGSISGGTTDGTTVTGATVTDATVTTGISGRLNFREITAPIKEEITQPSAGGSSTVDTNIPTGTVTTPVQ